jgi:hypothetical protein
MNNNTTETKNQQESLKDKPMPPQNLYWKIPTYICPDWGDHGQHECHCGYWKLNPLWIKWCIDNNEPY